MSCQLSSWLGTWAEDEEFEILEAAIEDSRLAATVKYRRGLFPWEDVDELSKQLAGHRVLDVSLEVVRTSFREVEGMETVALPRRVAELWKCLVHLLDTCDDASGSTSFQGA
ncbi:hypothetical protein PISMIDRAFT_19476 [Pisolithus microcarpus 441]|uniref:Uncharacterized protein n=1 Tax=Pisolithus microcarpus 441 TaxID=765257 RepID=A0A0C9Y345_9AGAM|nr:hypothetical protein BKA83DRAFT_19476 [Pisolithus microcarpus]KIK11496.1 hypothetical protein PISMIDRAFT_19476 [Pisolithus microcarpus 441]